VTEAGVSDPFKAVALADKKRPSPELWGGDMQRREFIALLGPLGGFMGFWAGLPPGTAQRYKGLSALAQLD